MKRKRLQEYYIFIFYELKNYFPVPVPVRLYKGSPMILKSTYEAFNNYNFEKSSLEIWGKRKIP